MMKPRIGISACLLGRKVRHNGGDKRNDWLVDQLGRFVEWVPFCPELEMGLGVPRPTMRLKGKLKDPQLIVKGTEQNLTLLARSTAERLLSEDLKLDSFIFKKGSPSCGLEHVKIYGKNDSPSSSAIGFFAAVFKEKYPSLPVIEEGRLSDPRQRERYLVKLFAFVRLRRLPREVASLQNYHKNQRFILMAHAPGHCRKLGAIAANSENIGVNELFSNYQSLFLDVINTSPSCNHWINVLLHMLGFFKNEISGGEKQQILRTFDDYRCGALPLIAVMTLMHHLAEKYSNRYLLDQAVFEPYPKGLLVMDRN